MLYQEPWTLDFEAFDGAWALADCNDARSDEGAALCLARMLVTRVVANAVWRRTRGEDLHEDLSCIEEYIEGMPIEACAARGLRQILRALTPYDPARVTEELLCACASATAAGHEGGARGFAELAYEAAATDGLDATAQGAALALTKLATLQEAPWNARKWRAIARLHGRRFARQRFAPL